MSKTTLDDLARMVMNGFIDVDKHFDGIQKQMDKRFDAVDKRFDRLEKENEVAHAAIIAELHSEIGSVRADISLIWKELKAINKRLDELIHWVMSFQRKLESSSGFRIKYGMTN